jgi:FkbM family methyltransferase
MNTGIAERIIRPEYIYQPGKLIRRVFGEGLDRRGEEIVELPWKMSIEVDSSEAIGRIISHHGIFELPVVEAMFRLVDRCDTVLDVGANIGYMTAVALAAGAERVVSFEPHPALFARLARNLQRWEREPRFAGRVNARNEAIDSVQGHSTLFIPKEGFESNQGVATLEAKTDFTAYDKLEVVCTTLDAVIDKHCAPVGLLKVDIEGHEFHAFKGASRTLRSGKVRDIVYESFEEMDSDASKYLAGFGYSIFRLRSSFTGPVLREGLKAGRLPLGDHNLVATLDPDRVRKRMSPRGYWCLNRKAGKGDRYGAQCSQNKPG